MSLQPVFDLSGKVALITGASRGIGEAIALAYSQAGARVVLASRKQADLDRVAGKIRESGGDALALGIWLQSPLLWSRRWQHSVASTWWLTTQPPTRISVPS